MDRNKEVYMLSVQAQILLDAVRQIKGDDFMEIRNIEAPKKPIKEVDKIYRPEDLVHGEWEVL